MSEAHGWLCWQISIGRERTRHAGALQVVEEACERRGWIRWDDGRGWTVTDQGHQALADAFITESSDPVDQARIVIRGPLKRETREHLQPPLIR